MRIQSAAIFALSGYLGGLVKAFWYAHKHTDRLLPLGPAGAILGLLLFAILYGIIFYIYGKVAYHRRSIASPKSVYISSAIIGFWFWFIILPIHNSVRDNLGLPDQIWWIESIILCIFSFETIWLLRRIREKLKYKQSTLV